LDLCAFIKGGKNMAKLSVAVFSFSFFLLCGLVIIACGSSGPAAPASVSLNNKTLTLIAGKTETLVATVSPANAVNKDIIWSSDKPDVVSVDEKGVIHANTVGTAVITVTTVDGQKTANCTVTVQLITMVRIDGGKFTMGSPATEYGSFTDENPQQEVTVSAFSMGEHLVTQKQWEIVMGANPSEFKGNDLPVEQISWYDALVFCNKLSIMNGFNPAYRIGGSTNPADWGAVPKDDNARWDAVQIVDSSNGYRLPTEAQWEFACRAGSSTPFYTGANLTTVQGNYDGRYPYQNHPKGVNRDRTTPVGSFPPNGWGLYDMHGNVWEWCWNWYGAYVAGPKTDPQGPNVGTYRVARSGSWSNRGQNLRSAARASSAPSFRGSNIGLRVVLP
jgi:formylglycine-generating enzyme required for sulfatase activity